MAIIRKKKLKASRSLKMRNAEFYLKGATVVTLCSRLQQDCPNSSSVGVGKTRLFPLALLRAQGQACRMSDEVHFAEMTGDRY